MNVFRTICAISSDHIENTGGTAAPTFDRYLHFTIVNDQNEILETMNNGRLYEYSLTGATTGKQTNDIGDTYYLSPGDYKLVVGIYNKGSNIPSAFVTKNFTMGPDASLEQ